MEVSDLVREPVVLSSNGPNHGMDQSGWSVDKDECCNKMHFIDA